MSATLEPKKSLLSRMYTDLDRYWFANLWSAIREAWKVVGGRNAAATATKLAVAIIMLSCVLIYWLSYDQVVDKARVIVASTVASAIVFALIILPLKLVRAPFEHERAVLAAKQAELDTEKENALRTIESRDAEIKAKNAAIVNKDAEIEKLTWPSNRPQIIFSTWDQIPQSHPSAILVDPTVAGHYLQKGFYLSNDGEAAHEITVERFEVEDHLWAASAQVPRIEAHGQGFALIWLGVDSLPIPDHRKWDLLGAMARAEQTKYGVSMYRPDYSVPVSVVYRDGNNVWYRSRSAVTYIRTQQRLDFGATTHERCGTTRPS